jgi:hypothetical protein
MAAFQGRPAAVTGEGQRDGGMRLIIAGGVREGSRGSGPSDLPRLTEAAPQRTTETSHVLRQHSAASWKGDRALRPAPRTWLGRKASLQPGSVAPPAPATILRRLDRQRRESFVTSGSNSARGFVIVVYACTRLSRVDLLHPGPCRARQAESLPPRPAAQLRDQALRVGGTVGFDSEDRVRTMLFEHVGVSAL